MRATAELSNEKPPSSTLALERHAVTHGLRLLRVSQVIDTYKDLYPSHSCSSAKSSSALDWPAKHTQRNERSAFGDRQVNCSKIDILRSKPVENPAVNLEVERVGSTSWTPSSVGSACVRFSRVLLSKTQFNINIGAYRLEMSYKKLWALPYA